MPVAPTDAGYRFYVESIADTVPLPAVEQLMIRHQFGQVEFASEHWFRLSDDLRRRRPPARHAREAERRPHPPGRPVAVNERMASLILVLREGGIKQAVLNLDEIEPVDQPTLNRVASLLNERPTDATAARAETILARSSPRSPSRAWPRHAGERIVRIIGDYDAASVEEVFSDGLLNVMEAPGVRQEARQATALENRVYLGELVGSVAGSGNIHIPIGAENQRAEMHDVSLVLACTADPARPLAWSGSSVRPGRAYSHAIGTVRFVSGLMNELVDHLYAQSTARAPRSAPTRSTSAPRGCSPTSRRSRARPRPRASRPRNTSSQLLQRERAEFLNFQGRTAEERQRDLGLAAEDLIRKVLVLADDFDRAIEARLDADRLGPLVRGR